MKMIKRRITVELSEETLTTLKQWLKIAPKNGSEGQLDLNSLTKMLLEDVAMTVTRPGSWEAAHMQRVLTGHGYEF